MHITHVRSLGLSLSLSFSRHFFCSARTMSCRTTPNMIDEGEESCTFFLVSRRRFSHIQYIFFLCCSLVDVYTQHILYRNFYVFIIVWSPFVVVVVVDVVVIAAYCYFFHHLFYFCEFVSMCFDCVFSFVFISFKISICCRTATSQIE